MYELTADVELLNEPLEIDVKFDNIEIIASDLANINAALDSLNGDSIAGQALDKIAYIELEAKQAIKESIENYDIVVGNDSFDNYYNYVNMIGSIVISPIKERLDIIHGQELTNIIASLDLLDQIKSDLIVSIEAKGSDVPASPVLANFKNYINAIEQIDIVPINSALDTLNGEVIAGDTLDKIDNANNAKIDMLNALEASGIDTGTTFDFPKLAEINTSLDLINEENIDGTTYDKLDYIIDWKNDIKTAIEAYGVSMTSAKPADYDSKVALIGNAVVAPIKTALDTANGEASASVDAAIDLVESNYAAIKAAITGVDMTGVKLSGYDEKIAELENETRFSMNPATGAIRIYGYNRWGKLDVVIPEKIRGAAVVALENNVFVPLSGEEPITSLVMPNTITSIGPSCAAYNYISTLVLSNSLSVISEQAFRNNGAMVELSLPASIEQVGIYAFFSNPITKITIGAGVVIANGGESPTMGTYGNAFETLYNGNGKLAGTYEYAAGSWSKTE